MTHKILVRKIDGTWYVFHDAQHGGKVACRRRTFDTALMHVRVLLSRKGR